MVEVSVLDRLMGQCLPLLAEISVIEVNDGRSDQLITEEIIVIKALNLEKRCSR